MSKGDKIDHYDVVILGGGAAGMAAALWCDELGLTACLLDSASKFGGQLHWIHNPIKNYPGGEFEHGGAAFRSFSKSLANRKFDQLSDCRAVSIDPSTLSVSLDGSRNLHAKAIVVATGVRRRTLDIPGATEFRNNGILESGSRDRAQTSGRTAAVIGGGDAALENALILADFAEKVYLLHRRQRFSGRKEFVNAVKKKERIELVLAAQVKEFGGGSALEFIDVELANGISRRIAIDNAVVRIGVQPNSELVREIVEVDDAGYIRVDREGRTTVSGIYAIGDVGNPVSPTLSTAVGSAASAVKSIAASIRTSE